MAALDFPASPAVNDRYPLPAVAGKPQYKWDGEKWTTTSTDTTVAPPATALPLMDQAAAVVGVTTKYAREDHVHPKIYAAPLDALAYSGMQINGSMDVSQQNAFNTPLTPGYIIDGWVMWRIGTMVLQCGSYAYAAASGFTNWLVVVVPTAQTSLAAGDYGHVYQIIEGCRISRLGWGASGARPLTIGFWSAHHRPGIYSVTVRNADNTRTYASTYTHAGADIAQYNVVTIPGDTAGTWVTNNTAGLTVIFPLAVGSSLTAPSANTWLASNYLAASGQINGVAATSDIFRITGVVVLPGIEAPSAERSPLIMRPYDQELLTCQRYWERVESEIFGYQLAGGYIEVIAPFKVMKRAGPTMSAVSWTSTSNAANQSTASGSVYKCIFSASAVATGTFYFRGMQADADARL
jgi:hypothetical protein